MKLIETLKGNTYIEQDDITPVINGITLNSIIDVIRRVTGVDDILLRAKTRRRPIVDARHLFFYFARDRTNESLQKIGNEVLRDHSSVLHGIKKIESLNGYDADITNYVKKIESML